MAMTTYDAREVTIVVDGTILTGFQDGDMVSFGKDNNFVEVQVDAQGEASAAINNDKLGTFTINLSASSPFNKKMVQLANSRKQFAVSVKHKTERASATKAFIEKTPDGAFGKATGSRTYAIKALDYKHDFT